MKEHAMGIRKAVKKRLTQTFHKVVGHPLSEVAFQAGLCRLSVWIYDATKPKVQK